MTDTESSHADVPDSPATAQPTSRLVQDLPTLDAGRVIRSKIQAPALRPETLTRDRLLNRLDEAMGSRLTLVTADAGYGKTTLLADYAARRGVRTLWYRLSDTDTNTVTWINYLLASCREVDPSFGAKTVSLLNESAASERVTASALFESFLGELTSWHDAPTMLVLDDFHEVDRFAEVSDLVRRIIDDAPDWFRIVIAGRRRPTFAMGRLAATASLAEIGTSDLRFSLDETERLFAESYSRPLDLDVLVALNDRMRGWAASLQLFRESIRDRPASHIRQILASVSGASGPIYDFLAEEVLASIPIDVQTFLLKASLLESLTRDSCLALFDLSDDPQSSASVQAWIDQTVDLSLLSRSSTSSDVVVMHPLLRDFLRRQVELRFRPEEVDALHLAVADRLRASDPLTAANHYIEAHRPASAMECLGQSILSTIGSGKWGVAAALLDRLTDVSPDPAVAAIRARRLVDDGNPAAAQRILADVDLSGSPPAVRAVVRQTMLTLGWRTANRELLLKTISELVGDPETPRILRDITQLFVDSGSFAGVPAPLRDLADRMVDMGTRERAAGHDFYVAIGFHNACVALVNAGEMESGVRAGLQALEAFEKLGFEAAERASCHVVVAIGLLELGRVEAAGEHIRAAHSGREFADVPAELSITYSVMGVADRASAMLARAEELHAGGRSDVAGVGLIDLAAALPILATDPLAAIERLTTDRFEWALDLGQALNRVAILAQAYLLAGNERLCLKVALPAIDEARRRGAKRALVRLRVIAALARHSDSDLALGLAEASAVGHLALPELADAICGSAALRADSAAVHQAIVEMPKRWLPALRRQLGKGAPEGNVAAQLLDQFGELEDVGRLRAYVKTYRGRGAQSGLGTALVRRVSPKLHIRDLGPVTLCVGDRTVALSGMRRKPGALLMYLATRPSYSANREQVLDELWPDADPESATNSLNQSLFFLRRDVDPWYEDGLSADYVHFAGDLVWLDAALVSTESRLFLAEADQVRSSVNGARSARDVLRRYSGHFAPEFEYEEWAINWRSRLRATLLELAQIAVDRQIRAGLLAEARETASAAIDADPSATDIERRLVWLKWHLGARSAARAQYDHLMRLEQEDDIAAPSFKELVAREVPI
jgi:LuxR family maltose regulon positive regulatory protein